MFNFVIYFDIAVIACKQFHFLSIVAQCAKIQYTYRAVLFTESLLHVPNGVLIYSILAVQGVNG